jgi:asparagine synthase (glutamine-hydrolysing)
VIVLGHRFATEGKVDPAVDTTRGVGDITVLDSAPGCYSVLLPQAGAFSAVTDPVGQFPLFMAAAGDRVLVGSSASALAARIDAPVDPVSLAARIACSGAPDLFATRTMFRGVRRVPEGTTVRVDASGVRETKSTRLDDDPSANIDEAAERLRDCLLRSINARIGVVDRMTADFSGGLDSTSLAFLAVAGGAPVVALTSYDAEIPGGSDDTEHAQRYARLHPLLEHRMVPGSLRHLPFQDLASVGDEPHAAPIFLGSLRSRLAVAATVGADLHLVGEGGDVLLGAPPACLADFARNGDLGTLWRHCVAWSRLRTRSPVRIFRRAVALGMTGRRQALLAFARDIQRGRPAGAPCWEDDWIGYWSRPHVDWLTQRARRQLAAEVTELATSEDQTGDAGDVVTRSWLRGQTLTQRAIRDAGQTFGISVQAPFLDSDVVRACLSVPAHRRIDPGVPKPLLRKALAPLVPGAVLARPTKGDYTGEAYRGVRRAAPVLRKLLADSAAADFGLLEPGPVRVALDNAIQGLPTPWGALNQVFAVELWLRERDGKVATV